jgi:hypothetical protein
MILQKKVVVDGFMVALAIIKHQSSIPYADILE